MFQGRIVKALSGFYYVEDNDNIIECRARGKFRKDEIKPLVGDFVEYQDGYIMKLLPRKNFLVRPPICNIDQALIVSSCKEPDFSSMLLDKFLLVVEHLNIEPIIVLSKMDLDDGSIESYVNDYRKAGYKVYEISSKDNYGIDEIKSIFKEAKEKIGMDQPTYSKSVQITDSNGQFSNKITYEHYNTRRRKKHKKIQNTSKYDATKNKKYHNGDKVSKNTFFLSHKRIITQIKQMFSKIYRLCMKIGKCLKLLYKKRE